MVAMIRRVFLLAALISLSTPRAHAHHSRAMFDTAKESTLSGTITQKTWRNPHVYFEISVPSSDSTQTETWVLEAGSVAGLVQSGWSESTINVGDRVTVVVAPHKDPNRRYAALLAVTVGDGTRHASFIPGAASTANAPSAAPSSDLSGTWSLANATNRSGAVGNEAVSGPTAAHDHVEARRTRRVNEEP